MCVLVHIGVSAQIGVSAEMGGGKHGYNITYSIFLLGGDGITCGEGGLFHGWCFRQSIGRSIGWAFLIYLYSISSKARCLISTGGFIPRCARKTYVRVRLTWFYRTCLLIWYRLQEQQTTTHIHTYTRTHAERRQRHARTAGEHTRTIAHHSYLVSTAVSRSNE